MHWVRGVDLQFTNLCEQALEVQISAAFAEHEAKLGQQQEALARQSQKGLATLQARINTLQTTLAADSAQHAAAYAGLQQQCDALQHDKEAACGKGNTSSVAHTLYALHSYAAIADGSAQYISQSVPCDRL